MNALITLHTAVFDRIERLEPAILPTLARFIFAAVLFIYYWNSAVLKLGDGGIGSLFAPNANMFGQMLPRAAEAVLWDITQATAGQKAIMLAGTWGEFILPVLLVLGLLTRYAAIGMIGFIAVQSWVDLFGHGGIDSAETLGAWFDNLPDGIILDQRAFWIFLLLYLVFRGAGPVSLDALLSRRASA